MRWLWAERLALETLALLGGREGIGKSIVSYTLAAALTRRRPGIYAGTPRAVIRGGNRGFLGTHIRAALNGGG